MSDKQEIRVDVVGSVDPKLQRDVDGLTQRVKASFADANKDIQNLGRTGMGQAGSLGQPPDKDILDRYTVKQQMLKNAIDQYGGMGAGERRNYSSQIKNLMRAVGAEPEEAARKLIYETSDAIESARGIGGERGRRAVSATNAWAERESDRVAGMQADSDMILGRAKELMGEGGAGGRSGRMLPSYIGTVVNTFGQLGVMGAGLYHAEKTMWDISNPTAMANAMLAKDIYETKTITHGIAGTVGSVGGGIIGGALGAAGSFGLGTAAGALAGSYLGSQIMAPIGEMVSTFLTASKEASVKLFNTLGTKMQQNISVYNGVQSAQATLAARGGAGIDQVADFAAKLGLSPQEAAALAITYEETSGGGSGGSFAELARFGRSNRLDMNMVMSLSRIGRFTGREMGAEQLGKAWGAAGRMGYNDATRPEFFQRLSGGFMQAAGVESSPDDIYHAGWSLASMPEAFYGAGHVSSFGRTAEGVQQIQNVYSALATPANEAQRAFMYTAFRKAHPDEGFMGTMLRMREGMFGEGNLSAIMGNIPPELRQEYILALTEGKNVNVGLTRDMMNSAGTEQGWSAFMGRWNSVEAQAERSGLAGDARQKFISDHLSGTAPLGETAAAETAAAMAEAGHNVQKDLVAINLSFEKWLDSIAGSQSALASIRDILGVTQKEAMEALRGVNPDIAKEYEENETAKKNDPFNAEGILARGSALFHGQPLTVIIHAGKAPEGSKGRVNR